MEEIVEVALQTVKERGLVKDGDRIAIAAAVLTGTPGSTNLLQIHIVGEETHPA